ncbi:hypothetical protein J6590_006828 [Homalodisca vitripennis]|nr:hypothetical protein J6590_006828 [Homalodisca vitripennis]
MDNDLPGNPRASDTIRLGRAVTHRTVAMTTGGRSGACAHLVHTIVSAGYWTVWASYRVARAAGTRHLSINYLNQIFLMPMTSETRSRSVVISPVVVSHDSIVSSLQDNYQLTCRQRTRASTISRSLCRSPVRAVPIFVSFCVTPAAVRAKSYTLVIT